MVRLTPDGRGQTDQISVTSRTVRKASGPWRAGIAVRPREFITQYHIDRKELANLRRRAVSTKEIAERYGCSATTVESALWRYGLMGR
jgi:hypothetical protein